MMRLIKRYIGAFIDGLKWRFKEKGRQNRYEFIDPIIKS